MSSSRQFVIMSLHRGQKYYHKVCANYLLHSAISSVVSRKGSRIILVYRMCLYLLANTFNMVSNTKKVLKTSICTKFWASIMHNYDRCHIHAVWDGHFLGPLCVNSRCNFVNCYKQQHLSALFH